MGYADLWQARYEQARRVDADLRELSDQDALLVFTAAHDHWAADRRAGMTLLEAFEQAVEDTAPTTPEREEVAS
jgi:hypothetical protein